jgi:hypothetical protein
MPEMAAKKRKDSIYVIHEGDREGSFLAYLAGHGSVRFNPVPCRGGNANEIVITGIKHSARDVNVYVFFDEDFESKSSQYTISDEILEGLAVKWNIERNALKGCRYRDLQKLNANLRNPVLIVSSPHSIEGILLRLLGKPLPDLERKTTKELKNMLASFMDNIPLNNEDNDKIQDIDRKISKYSAEITRLKKTEPQNTKSLHFFEGKIKNCKEDKERVKFIRFLGEKLPLPVIIARRDDSHEVDILLKAFGL